MKFTQILFGLLAASSAVASPTTCSKTYTVKSGDYCSLIASNNGVTVNSITTCTNAMGNLGSRKLDDATCGIWVGDVLCLACSTTSSTGKFRVAPYYELVVQGNPSLSGMKYATFAFTTADANKNPSFEGSALASYSSIITNFKNGGGIPIMSFGGALGNELAVVQTDETKLKAAYQTFITSYGIKKFDFDIEGPTASDTNAQGRRNRAIKALQTQYTDLEVMFTVAISSTGLPATQVNIIKNARAAGVKISTVNVMLFDYGSATTVSNLEASKTALNALRNQLNAIDVNIKMGATIMIGKDDLGKVITVAETKSLLDWIVANHPTCTHVSFWAMHRDKPGSGPLYSNAGITGFTAGDYLKTFKLYAA